MNPSRLPPIPPVSPTPSVAATCRRYAGIYGILWRTSVMREMGFKSSFLLWIVVELLWFGLQLSLVGVIYLHTDHVGDWTKWQVVMLVGVSHLIQQMFQAIFMTNLTQLSELIRTGRFDFLLLMPANTRFLVSLRQVDLGGFVNSCSSLAVIAYAARQLNYVPGPAQLLGFLGLVVAGVLIHYSLMFMLVTTSFWTVRAQGVLYSYYSLFNIARSPDAAFQGVFKAFFTFVLPVLLVSNVPVKVLAGKLVASWEVPVLLGLGLAAFLASSRVWRLAMRHYTSASS